MKLSDKAMALVDEYRREPGADLIDFSRTDAYRRFVEAAEIVGFTGPDIEMDSEFSYHSPEWVAQADGAALRCWVHTLIRCDRWNVECPTAVMDACRSGCMSALADRLAGYCIK